MPFGFSGIGATSIVPVPNSAPLDAPATATITINALASGAAQQSNYIQNVNNRPRAKVTLEIVMGAAAPTLGTIVELWLLRSKAIVLAGLTGDDNTTDANQVYPTPPGLPRNATLIGAISVTATANGTFRGSFDTESVGVLGAFFAFAVSNRTNVALGTSANNLITYQTY